MKQTNTKEEWAAYFNTPLTAAQKKHIADTKAKTADEDRRQNIQNHS